MQLSNGFSRRDQRSVDERVQPHQHHQQPQERRGFPRHDHDHDHDDVEYDPRPGRSTGRHDGRFGVVNDSRRASRTAPFFYDDVSRVESPSHVDVPCLSRPIVLPGFARHLYHDKPTHARTLYRPYPLDGYGPAPSHRVLVRDDDDDVGLHDHDPQHDHCRLLRPVRRPSPDARLDHHHTGTRLPEWSSLGPSPTPCDPEHRFAYERRHHPIQTHHTTNSRGHAPYGVPPQVKASSARGRVHTTNKTVTAISDTSIESGSTPSSTSLRATAADAAVVATVTVTATVTATPPPPPQKPKQSRYLREIDRRAILARLDQGERQSVLAKEYDVSRSTICNLFRQRDVVLARANENPLARHPKKKTRTRAGGPLSHARTHVSEPTAANVEEASGGSGGSIIERPRTNIHVQSRAITRLQQTLCHARTSSDEFQRCRARLMRLLIEESLAIVASRVRPSTSDGGRGAVSMETAGRAWMLDTFRVLEPDAPAGLLVLSRLCWTTHDDVLLLDNVVTSTRDVDVAMETLRSRGASVERLTLVALVVAPAVVAHVQATYPQVYIVSTRVDGTLSEDGGDGRDNARSPLLERLRARRGAGVPCCGKPRASGDDVAIEC